MARLFFALRPAQDAAATLAALGQATCATVGGRGVPRDNIHLTLAFLGELDAAAEALACAVADRVHGSPFPLALDELGGFRRARVAWAGSSSPDPALVALQGELESGLRAAGFALEERPFTPHVTLARKVERMPARMALPVIAWRVTEFVLMRSSAGRYETVATWALREGSELRSPPARG